MKSSLRQNAKNKKKNTASSRVEESSVQKKTTKMNTNNLNDGDNEGSNNINGNEDFRIKNRHRMLFLMKQLSSRNVEIHLSNGKVVCGLIRAIHPTSLEAIVQCARIKKGKLPERFETGQTLSISPNQVLHMRILSVPLFDEKMTNGSAKFLTDSQISSADRANLVGRTLEVASSWLDPNSDHDDGLLMNDKNIDKWDQFEANERLFGVQDRFDENLYTTKLDKDKVSNEIKMKAMRIAKEIEGETSSNPHVLEERGKNLTWKRGASFMCDEEQKYSAVLREKESDFGSWRRPMDNKSKDRTDYKNKGKESKLQRNEDKEIKRNEQVSPKREDRTPIIEGCDKNTENKEDVQEVENIPETSTSGKMKTPSFDMAENDAVKKKLNPNAKEFVFNISAPSFKPSGSDTTTPNLAYNKQSNMNNSTHLNNRRVHRYKGAPIGMPQMMEQEYLQPHCMPMPYPMMYPAGEWYVPFDASAIPPPRYYPNEQPMIPGPVPYGIHGAHQGVQHVQPPLVHMQSPGQKYYAFPTANGVDDRSHSPENTQQNEQNTKEKSRDENPTGDKSSEES